ncbi:dihydrolipoyl dehydrogenase [Marinicrinis lubricantis]|uniref:Dihydrolipoyl dehydrogenase n=1 Tax=Marinicrinis lubricantis TaxID=2086470 RepID=A0ABW1ISI9_9BACL
MEAIQCDVVILGGGIAGYTAAIRASQLGKKALVVESRKLGGTCLHRGCIPSKALLKSAELFSQMKRSSEFGIQTGELTVDFGRIQARKNEVVNQLYEGVQLLMRKNKIDVIQGKGRLMGPSIFSPNSGAVAVEMEDGEMVTVVGKSTIIATGSRPRTLTGLPQDEKIMTSDEAFQMEQLPDSIAIIGGGVIGVEWASMLNDLGVKVTLIEASDRLLPMEDEAVSREIRRIFEGRGIQVRTGASIIPERVEPGGNLVQYTIDVSGQEETLEAERMLVSVGRAANVEEIGLENTDVQVAGGVIRVNSHYQTNENHIYAVGDVNGGLQLAHAAAHEAICAVEHLTGQAAYHTPAHRIPKCIYSRPEIGSVGMTESEAKSSGRRLKTGMFPFKALGKAWVMGETEGFVKVIADADNDDVLGVHIVGAHATDLISEASLAQLLEATPWEVSLAIHPHPTLSEAISEAMLAVDGKAIGI